MVVTPELSRSAKILVATGLDFEAASKKLATLTLDIVVGADVANEVAGQAAVLTAVTTGGRSFAGGVRVRGGEGVALRIPVPVDAVTLDAAAAVLGACDRDTPADRTIFIGNPTLDPVAAAGATTVGWFDGWRVGYAPTAASGNADNPLAGAVAGALSVGAAFRDACGLPYEVEAATSLWNPSEPNAAAPSFSEVYVPNKVWLLGLGNLGQAFLWALSLLPYEKGALDLVLQDADRVTPENWGTSVLVAKNIYGDLKTRISEDWALKRGFNVRRLDRRLLAHDRLEPDDPRVALCGFDSVASRRLVTEVGFDVVVDAGLGRTAQDYERYRVNVFDAEVSMSHYLETLRDADDGDVIPEDAAYRDLEDKIGRCGMVEIAGAAAATPYVSAVAACIAVTRLLQVASSCEHCSAEVGRAGALSRRRTAGWRVADARGVGAVRQAHATG